LDHLDLLLVAVGVAEELLVASRMKDHEFIECIISVEIRLTNQLVQIG
jgi:hypothetical protein